MCVGAILELVALWDEDGARTGRLADGSVVTLGFVPRAEVGAQLLVHLGIPVEVLDPGTAAETIALRERAVQEMNGGPP